MDLNELRSIIRSGESENLEFKKSTASLKSAAETLCGFLNNNGGRVLIGVSDTKTIVGQHIADQTQQEIASILRKFEPTANVDLEYVDVENDRKVIVMTTHPDKYVMPYTFNGRAYERKGTATHLMPRSRYQQLLLKNTVSPVVWEELAASGITIDDLDHEEIVRTLKDGIRSKRIDSSADTDDPNEILKKLDLLKSGKITNAAAVLYLKKVPAHYYQCVLRIARFRGIIKRDLIDSKHLFGNAFLLLSEAENFINRHTSVASRFEEGNFQRIDEPEYPVKAIREAIINALCHRDYSSPSGSITIAIYDDRIEIASTGKLPNDLTPDDLKRVHVSAPRNRCITNVFFRRGLIEAFGIGTQEIIRSCREANMKDPDFFEQAGSFFVCLWSKHYREPLSDESQLTSRQLEIIELLRSSDGLPPSQILSRLSQEISDRTLRTELRELKAKGLIDSTGKGPKTLWFFKQ